MTDIVVVFLTYVALTLGGVVVAKVLIVFVLNQIRQPPRPDKKVAETAAESLRMATDLSLDARAFYEQLCGKVNHA